MSNAYAPFGWDLSTAELKKPLRIQNFNFYENWHVLFIGYIFPYLQISRNFFYLSRTLRNEESSIIHIEKIKTSYGRKKLTGM